MRRVRVLLADDHETVREGLRAILDAQPDIEVIAEAADGEAAISKVGSLHPDIVVMDLSMPGMNGLEATEALTRSDPPVRVLTLTRHAEAAYLQSLLRAGVSGYVLKQSRSQELLNAIRSIAAGGKYLDPALSGKVMGTFRRSPAQMAAASDELSQREEEVIRLVAWGYSNKEIATKLDLSVKTVETHKAHAASKLGLQSRIEVVRYALMRGWLKDP
jgi:DNA-binding NarL/FixJ family response regulator